MATKDFTGEGTHGADAFDFIAEKFNPNHRVIVGRPQFNHIAAHAETTALKGDVTAAVLNFHQFAQ